jgi:hypothetical protein
VEPPAGGAPTLVNPSGVISGARAG